MRRYLALIAIFAAAVLSLGVAATPAKAQTTLKWAHVYEVGEPFHVWAQWVATEFAKRTNGRYKIEVFAASTLGKESDINEGLGIGTVDIIYTGLPFAARNYGPLAIANAPYIMRDTDHWLKFRDSALFKELAEGYNKASGNRIVALTWHGSRELIANKPITKPEDMRGFKKRIPDAPLFNMFPRAVGANPTPIALGEVYLALQQGVVDGAGVSLNTIDAKKFYETQEYIILSGHMIDQIVTIIGGPTWGKMKEEDRNILVSLSQEAAAKCTADIHKNESELADKFRKMGKKVLQVDRAKFREAVIGSHLTGPGVSWNKDVYDRLQAIK